MLRIRLLAAFAAASIHLPAVADSVAASAPAVPAPAAAPAVNDPVAEVPSPTAKPPEPDDDERWAKIIGDGYTQIVELKKATGNIGVGIAYQTRDEDGIVLIKKGDGDPLITRSSFGRFMLVPGSAETGAYLRFRRFAVPGLDWLSKKAFGKNRDSDFGLMFEGEAGSASWKVTTPSESDPDVTTEQQKDATVFAATLGVALRTRPKWLKANNVRFVMNVGATVRSLEGDAGQPRPFRDAALGDVNPTALGLQVGGELTINDVYASATASHFPGNEIEGLSGGQLVVALGFRGGIKLK